MVWGLQSCIFVPRHLDLRADGLSVIGRRKDPPLDDGAERAEMSCPRLTHSRRTLRSIEYLKGIGRSGGNDAFRPQLLWKRSLVGGQSIRSSRVSCEFSSMAQRSIELTGKMETSINELKMTKGKLRGDAERSTASEVLIP